MLISEMKEIMDENDNLYLHFQLVKEKLHNRRDIHAFLLLDKLEPDTFPMLTDAGKSQVWLASDLEKIAEVITKEQVIELVCCGVLYDDENDCFYMII